MKRLITLALSMVFVLTAFGQRLEYDKSSKWFFGIDAGAAWNTTDVQNKTYAGWGFMFGRSFNYDYGRALSYDLRFRYLRGKWYGQDYDSTNLSHLGSAYTGALSDYKTNLGYTVNNYQADVNELGAELAIHFNRVRDRSGWDPYIFGGANLVWNKTYGDLMDEANSLVNPEPYAYDQIDMTKPAINLALDGNYETALDGTNASRYNVNFMPSLGIGLGYDFGPRFSMGVEHKTTFTLKDDFDGYVDATPNWGFLQNDVYHYTSAFMRFRFRNGEGRTRPVNTNTGTTTNNGLTNTNPCQLPEVRTTRPLQRNETVVDQAYVFKSEVRFVQSRNQIVMRVNGLETTNFLYNPDTHQLEAYLSLMPGSNTIEIAGRNNCGTDTETSTIVYNNCIDPIVNFQNVSNNAAQVEQQNYSVQSQISGATNVEFTVNGVLITNFSYNSSTNQFVANISLVRGQNTIRITAVNACGTDTETIVVTYTDCAPPMVSFTNGNGGFIAVSRANFDLTAYVFNVINKNNITVRLNGSNQVFNFTPSTNLVSANLVLSQGQNTVQIVSTNNCGTDTENLTIDYTPCIAPTIQLIQPLSQSSTSANSTQLIKAKLYNIVNSNQIQLRVNGNLELGGVYNAVTKMFEASVPLNAGLNTIQITAINDCGSATETISVNYSPCSAPDVQLIFPASSGGSTSSASQLVQAVVFNVNNINEIRTYVNGTQQNGGTYSSANGLYQNTVNLNLGVNSVQVVATNSCGSDVETVTITYRQCEAPMITFMSPNTSTTATTATNINISAMVSNVTNATQIQLTVNGVIDATGASYASGTNTYQNNVNLTVGNNVINISATNSCGTVMRQINVVREVVIVNDPNAADSIVICKPAGNNSGNPTTLTIPLSMWTSYQSMGAALGPCPVIVEPVDLPMIICYTMNGSPTTIQILTSEWPVYQAMGATQGACPVQTMNICLNGSQLTIPVSQWSLYQGQGATEGACPVSEETIVICHKPPGNPTNTQELTIPISAWAAHQAHGDNLGPCPPPVDPQITICLNGSQMTILTSQWATYQSQGATQGPCPIYADPQITICLNGTQMTILNSQWAFYQAQGAAQGACPEVDEMIVICHKPPGNPTNTQELTIPISAWAAHQAHGDNLGPCPTNADPIITICALERGVRTTMQIKTSQWPKYQVKGATMGACTPNPLDTINVGGDGIGNPDTLNGNVGRPVINDGSSDGSSLGGDELLFADQTITVCHTPEGSISSQTMQVPLNQWSQYQAQGATLGPCVGTVQGGGNTGSTNANTNSTGSGNGIGGVPINPNGTQGGGTNTGGGNMPTVGNGSQQAQQDAIRKQQQEAAAKKAAEQQAAERQAEEAKRKAAADQAEKVRQAEEAKRKAAADEAEKARQAEEVKRKVAADQAEKARQAEEAKRKAAADEAEKVPQAEEVKRKSAADQAEKARQAEEAKRKAAEEEAEKALQEKTEQEAAAKKAEEEAEKKKAEEERLKKERGGGR